MSKEEKDPRRGFKVGDRVRIGSSYMGRSWNEGLVGTIEGFEDGGSYSTAVIKIELKERAGVVRISKVRDQ